VSPHPEEKISKSDDEIAARLGRVAEVGFFDLSVFSGRQVERAPACRSRRARHGDAIAVGVDR
jgi:hypothetical protein